jgi:hypothetical protein
VIPVHVQSFPAQAHIAQRCEGATAPGRSQNRMHVQKALMEFLLLGRIG